MITVMMIAAFQEAIAKYEVVLQNLEFARELQKQFQSIGNDVSPSDRNEIEFDAVDFNVCPMP